MYVIVKFPSLSQSHRTIKGSNRHSSIAPKRGFRLAPSIFNAYSIRPCTGCSWHSLALATGAFCTEFDPPRHSGKRIYTHGSMKDSNVTQNALRFGEMDVRFSYGGTIKV